MKQKMKKLVATLLALTCLSTVPYNVAGATSVKGFSDVPAEYWGYETIMEMTEVGIFKGTTEPIDGIGTFSPEKVMTRAEFVTASLRAIFPEEASLVENDSTKWWNSYYTLALQKGIVEKTELDGGDLDKPMTREEMAMVMVRCVEQNSEKLSRKISATQIPDYAQIGNYYKDYVLTCFSFGLLCGVDEKGTFAPAKSLTRAEAATVLCRLIDKDMRVEVEFIYLPIINNSNDSYVDNTEQEKLPWENGGKQPSEYTWAEFEALPGSQKDAFVDSFGSTEAFEQWKITAQGSQNEEKLPWENGGKQPSDYTWAEFEALPYTQKDAFIESFESDQAFEEWMSEAQKAQNEEKLPWENGGKTPSDYTWAEFEELPDSQKDAFIQSFGNTEAFEKWMREAQGAQNTEKLPWENGGKQPSDYTWAEFEELTSLQKDAFIQSFKKTEDFEEWMSIAQGSYNDTLIPWENGGKQPSDYTWEEFDELTAFQKDAFIQSFKKPQEFEEWMSNAQPPQIDTIPSWENGGKQPSEYTWAEFIALPDSHKDAFIQSFGSSAAYEEWMSAAQGSQNDAELPWENGGKHPSEYTWEEFQELPDSYKDAFIESFDDPEDFALWINANQP